MKRDKVYKTGASLRTALEDRLGKIAMEESVDLQRIRRQVSFDRILARLGSTPDSPWVLKGGYAMELRYHKARANKDLDFTMRLTSKSAPGKDQILALLQEAAAADMDEGDYVLQIKVRDKQAKEKLAIVFQSIAFTVRNPAK